MILLDFLIFKNEKNGVKNEKNGVKKREKRSCRTNVCTCKNMFFNSIKNDKKILKLSFLIWYTLKNDKNGVLILWRKKEK